MWAKIRESLKGGTCDADHDRGRPYTKDELANKPAAWLAAARCKTEYKDAAVLADIQATTGLNSPLWMHGWGLLIPAIILLFAIGIAYRP